MSHAWFHRPRHQRLSTGCAMMIVSALCAAALAGDVPPCLNPLTVHGEGPLTGFGLAVESIGDFDDDGIRDLVVGAFLYPDQGVNIGRVYF